jgi:hypothetical protein
MEAFMRPIWQIGAVKGQIGDKIKSLISNEIDGIREVR